MNHSVFEEIVWTTIFKVGRCDMDDQNYDNMQNLKYGVGTDIWAIILKGFH